MSHRQFGSSRRPLRRWLVPVLVASLLGTLVGAPGFGATPESPEVKQMIQKGISYLEKNASADNHVKELGGISVVALAILKNMPHNLEGALKERHPLIAAAIQACRAYAPQPPGFKENNYSIGLAIIFLCELDAEKYRPEIDKLMNEMLRRQRDFGAWTYEGNPNGDTSQTQYSALAMWIAHRSNITVPVEAAERCANWLIRTQAPNGGFTYLAVDPGNTNRINQQADRMTPTMGAAGTGSLLICGEILGYIQTTGDVLDDLPPAVREITSQVPMGARSRNVDSTLLRRAINDGMRWMSNNQPVQIAAQQYYYMYSLERYHAFRELLEGKFEKEPTWYNSGVTYMQRNQAADGSWKSGEQGPVIDTAFGILFLLRSAKKSIARVIVEQGLLSGGKGGLPKDLTNINVTTAGKVVANSFAGAVDDVLKLLEDPTNPQGDFLADIPEEIQVERDPQKRAAQMARFRRLAISGSFQARLTAVKTISKVRDLENVPALIYALTDPDPRIVTEARKGLMFVSRKLEAYGPPENPTREQQLEAVKNWSTWYKSIKPDGELIE